jgi:hypothetical protein
MLFFLEQALVHVFVQMKVHKKKISRTHKTEKISYGNQVSMETWKLTFDRKSAVEINLAHPTCTTLSCFVVSTLLFLFSHTWTSSQMAPDLNPIE